MSEPVVEGSSAKVVALGERLRQRREERGLSQAQAARELDVARTAYRLWELEAAKPSPDRWRLIARWLGVSISTMLLGEDLIDDEDADAADLIARAADETSEDRLLQTMGARAGVIPPGVFRKELIADSSAPELARTALLVTSVGVDEDVFERAELLTSELVTNSVVRSAGGSVLLVITMHPHVLRVEVTDATATPEEAKPRDQRMRWSLAITAELASRWGAGRDADLNVSWFEIDIPSPG